MIVFPAYLCVFWLKVPHSNRQYCQVVYTLAEDIFQPVSSVPGRRNTYSWCLLKSTILVGNITVWCHNKT